jgi:hypothetical protein
VNNGPILDLIFRSDEAQSSSVVSIEVPIIHDLRIMATHGFRQSQNVQLDTSNNCVSVAGSMVRVTERVRVRVKAALWASSELALGE